MKQLIKASLLAWLLCSGVIWAEAQHVIRVRVRPTRPSVVVQQTPSPGNGYVWVDEDWEPGDREYTWKGGYWVAPPRSGAVWVKGHWMKVRGRWEWMPGHWK